MSARHVRWVLAHRNEYNDDIDREIAIAIASHIGTDNSPATVSMATIAEYAGVHYNTVDRRTKAMQERGLLTIGKEGRFLTYSLPADADDEGTAGEEAHSPAERDVPLRELAKLQETVASLQGELKEMKRMVTALCDVHMNVTSPSHERHLTFTPGQGEDVNKEGKEGRRKVGKKTPPPLTPLSDSPADERVKAIGDVCELDLDINAVRQECETASAQLAKYSATEIRQRYGRHEGERVPPGWNWWRDHWKGEDGEAPTPKWILKTITLRKPDRPSTSANGQQDTAEREAQRIMEIVENDLAE